MRIKILLFASLSQAVSGGTLTVELSDGASVSDACDAVARACPSIAGRLRSVAFARNESVARLEDRLFDGDELAFLPPVSGGGGRSTPHLTHEPILTEALVAQAGDSGGGAVLLFLGTVRDHARDQKVTGIDYEAYEPMAEKTLSALEARIRSRPGIRGAEIRHRLGPLKVGEASVAIVVSAAHRGEAFDACREAIESLKKDVPIWKREYAANGTIWVEGSETRPA